MNPTQTAKIGFVLASSSPARATVLRNAGIEPAIIVPDVDEAAILKPLQAQGAPAPAQVQALAWAKARRATELVAEGAEGAEGLAGAVAIEKPTLLVACDSMLEFAGQMQGKPGSPEVAFERIRQMQGQDAVLWTGHAMVMLDPELPARRLVANLRPVGGSKLPPGAAEGAAATTVHFGSMSDDEIRAYVSTGEPLHVAGSFTIDGLGGAFLDGITGDPHSVIGISLPLLRQMAKKLGVFWPDLWNAH